jgi:hypothetical protein
MEDESRIIRGISVLVEADLRLTTPRPTMVRATGIKTDHGKRTILGSGWLAGWHRRRRLGCQNPPKQPGSLEVGSSELGFS